MSGGTCWNGASDSLCTESGNDLYLRGKCSEGAVKGSMLLSWQPMWTGHIFIIISFSIPPIWTVTGSFVISGFQELHRRD